MIRIEQLSDSDCYSACVASLLGKSIQEIPDIFQYDEEEWFEQFCADLESEFGVNAISFTPESVPHGVYTRYTDYWIATIHTEFTPVDGHAVIMRENRVVFDPTNDINYRIDEGMHMDDLEITMCTILFRCV